MKISVVVNTFNEEKNIERCLRSVEDFADEIVVVDMHSVDKTIQIAKKFDAKVFEHEYTRYVEPARNFAISKAKGDWILVLDPDEELSPSLKIKLRQTSLREDIDFVEIPRKNIIFNKWISHSRWWPDYLKRFFRRKKVRYSDRIHIQPQIEGNGMKLEVEEQYAIIHHHFQTISQFVERLNRYTDIQAEEIKKTNYVFEGKDLVIKPANEFFSRFFAGEGYKDGLHGLGLALLQGFSELVVYLKVWEKSGFDEQKLEGSNGSFEKVIKDFYFWRGRTSATLLKKTYFKIRSKI